MTDDLVKRLRDFTCDCFSGNSKHMAWDAADHIEGLEYALRSIAEVPIGAEIPDRTTIWGLAVHMQETARYALKERET